MSGNPDETGPPAMAQAAQAEPSPVASEYTPTARVPAVRMAPEPRAVLDGIIVALLGAWGAVVAYAGPWFHFGPAGAAAWQWTIPHAVLNLLPGLGGLAAGLMMTMSRRGGGLILNRIAGLTALGAGAWFVLGRAIYPIFYGTAAPPYGAATHSALANFVTVLGYGLGVGILLAAFGGVFLGMRPYRPVEAPGETAVPRSRGLHLRNTEPAAL